MAEMRVSSIIIVLVLVGIVGFLVLTFGGWMAIGWFRKENFDKGLALAKGYTKAETAEQALDKFREAIQARDYNSASYYVTKDYSDLLKKTHAKANELGGYLDKINDWGKEKGILTDKLKVALFYADPFPKNFKASPTKPKEEGGKASGSYVWDLPYTLDNPGATLQNETGLDPKMFKNILSYQAFNGKIDLVKEGDEWKISLVVGPQWVAEANHFNDRAQTYITGLHGFWKDVNNQRYSKKQEYEGDVMQVFRSAK